MEEHPSALYFFFPVVFTTSFSIIPPYTVPILTFRHRLLFLFRFFFGPRLRERGIRENLEMGSCLLA